MLAIGLVIFNCAPAQLKFIVDDFEGFCNGTADLQKNGVFAYGNCSVTIDHEGTEERKNNGADYLGDRYITISKKKTTEYGGWGKGIGLNVELDATTDHLNFYIHQKQNTNLVFKIELQEDDNGDDVYKVEQDDSWLHQYEVKPQASNEWQLISVPLKDFKDINGGGDGVFNCSYKDGKLLTLIVSITGDQSQESTFSMDFICFSKGTLQGFISPAQSWCSLGLWSKEEKSTDFTDIGNTFEKMLGPEKKLGVIHFFQPFALDGGTYQNNYPSVERVNKIITDGYTPLITLENHFVNVNSRMKQPNLYSITEGHMDDFFTKWAGQIKQIKGVVLMRILHEFNGNWYPWCIANNDRNPELFVQAFRRIHHIFKMAGADNVKFIWCPNSMSVPQEKWNFIMDAYPGDEYVDLVGLDIYNGSGVESSVWRSFRKEGIENYFMLTDRLPAKPLLVCEAASRERGAGEGEGQTKAQWVAQLSEALQSDMRAIKLLAWFNEKSTFKINSSPSSKKAFQDRIIKAGYFRSGNQPLLSQFK